MPASTWLPGLAAAAAGDVGSSGTALFDFGGGRHAPSERFTASDFVSGWQRFGDLWFMADMVAVLVLSALLGAALAYHPLTRAKAATLEELEQPKTFIMYAIVGAVIGLIVPVYPVMGAVIFGLGGLLRFRTNVGPAKDTGRVILAVIVGAACGLKLMPVAIVATLFAWLIIWALERQEITRISVKGVTREVLPRSAEAYRQLLTGAGCKILSEKKKFTKGTVTFVFTAAAGFDKEALEERIVQALPDDVRGWIDWDIA